MSLTLIDFLLVVGRLKRVRRQGWVDRGIAAPESVADHSYRNAMMAWILGDVAGLDTDRLVKLMLVHDLPEAEVGDGTPYAHLVDSGSEPSDIVGRWRDLVNPEDLASMRDARHSREREALAGLTRELPTALGSTLVDLWQDYAEGRSPEARFAAQIDKLEALLQALEYQADGQPADVENFLVGAREVVSHPVLIELLEKLEQMT